MILTHQIVQTVSHVGPSEQGPPQSQQHSAMARAPVYYDTETSIQNVYDNHASSEAASSLICSHLIHDHISMHGNVGTELQVAF